MHSIIDGGIFFVVAFYIILSISIPCEGILAPTKIEHFLFSNFPIDKGISQNLYFRKGQPEKITMSLKPQIDLICRFTEIGSVYFLMKTFLD